MWWELRLAAQRVRRRCPGLGDARCASPTFRVGRHGDLASLLPVRFPPDNIKMHQLALVLVVEVVGIEPTSEKDLQGASSRVAS